MIRVFIKHPTLTSTSRCKGKQGDGREGQRQRADERRAAGYQEIWKEIGIASDSYRDDGGVGSVSWSSSLLYVTSS